MIARRTVLVLGAGASAPYRFSPDLSRKIREQIGRPTNPATPFVLDLEKCGHEIDSIRDFARRLAESGVSVDEFIVDHPDFRDIGKLAIARAVAPWEHLPVLDPFYDEDHKEHGAQRWYQYCFRRMRLNATGRCNIEDNQLTVVTFNFDRSFERALYNFVLANCVRDFDPARAREIVKKIPVHHIHGQLGEPSWLRNESEDSTEVFWRDYGHADFSPEALHACAAQLKIIDDEVEKDPAVHLAREAIAKAQRVCFLGFSYNPLNLQKLQLNASPVNPMLGTAFEMSPGEIEGARRSFRRVASKELLIDADQNEHALTFLRRTKVIHD